MIQLPEDFNAAALVADLLRLAAPFAGIAMLIACGILISRILKSTP